MMFDHVIGNPPYQREDHTEASSRRVTTDIFPLFQKMANTYAVSTSLIYPATWQKNITEGLGKLLNDNGIYRSDYYDGSTVFATITKGYPLSVVYTHRGYDGDICINSTPQPRTNAVWIAESYQSKLYAASRGFPMLGGASDPTSLVNIASSDLPFTLCEEDFNDPVNVYIKKNPGVQSDADYYWTERTLLEPLMKIPESLDEYSVSIRSAPIGRMRFFNELRFSGKSLGAQVFGIGETHSNTWAELRRFSSREEAENFAAYVNTGFFITLAALDFTKRNFAAHVPDLVDYTNTNPNINWNEPLTEQLHEMFGVDQ